MVVHRKYNTSILGIDKMNVLFKGKQMQGIEQINRTTEYIWWTDGQVRVTYNL